MTGWLAAVCGAGAGVALWWGFALQHQSLPVWLRFAVAGSLFLFGPGAAIVWPALSSAPLSRRVILALAVGLAAAPLLAHVLYAAGSFELFPYVAAGLSGAVIARWGRSHAARANLLGPVLLVLLAFAMGYVTYANRVGTLPERTIYYGEYDSYDLSYYAAIASELTHTIPPTAPFHAGRQLNHAFYPQIVPALLRRFADVPLLDTYLHYYWPACLALLALMCFVFVESIAAPTAAFLAALLLIIGSDLSYLFAWFYPRLHASWDRVVWSANLLSPSAETLLFNNWTPTLAVVFAGLYALAACERDSRRVWFLVAAGCFAVTAQFKPFAHTSLAVALIGATLASWREPEARRRFVAVGVLTALLSLPYMYRIITLMDDAQVTFAPALFILPRAMLRRLSLDESWIAWTESLGLYGVAQTFVVGALATPLFLVAGFGFRLVGVPILLRCIVRPRQEAPVWRLLAWIIVAAAVPPFVIATTPVSYETMHFHQFALFLLPIFVARQVASWRSTAVRAVAAGCVIAVAAPSTLHYLQRKWTDQEARPHAHVTTEEVAAARLLRETDPERTVVLHNRPRDASYIVIFSERRAVLAWADYVRGSRHRQHDVNRFFKSAHGTEAAALTILEKYRPTHIIAYSHLDHIHPAVVARLRPVFQESTVTLYEVPDTLYASPPTSMHD